jgi:hypothetical protein
MTISGIAQFAQNIAQRSSAYPDLVNGYAARLTP